MENCFRYVLKMDRKEFKKLFGEVAKVNGFESAFGSWYKESAESFIILELQKSKFGNYFQFLIKIFIQGAFERRYSANKELMKSSIGHITLNEPTSYQRIFDFDQPMKDDERKEQLNQLFNNYIIPLKNKTLTKSGIRILAEKGEITLLPAVKEELS